MTASDADIIKSQLRFIRENADALTEKELELPSSFEKQFNLRGKLSKRQMEILEEIYRRRT